MLVALFKLLSRLPLPLLHAIGAALGWLVYLTSPTYRSRLQQHLSRAGYSSHLRNAIGESGKSIMELAFVWYAPLPRMLAAATIENWEIAQTALDAGRGVIFLTPHLGCFEILAQTVATRIPLTVLYRPPRKAALKPLMEDARMRASLSLAPANLSGVRTLLKLVKQKRAIGLMPDQVPQQGEGVWADFFGSPAYTMTLPGKLYQMTGAAVVLAYAERLPRGRGFNLRFVPFTHSLDGDAEQQARAINLAMEQLIAECPAQYFWSYQRYKTPAGATAPSKPQQEQACG